MAIQTRYAGDSNPLVNVDSGVQLGAIIATGLTKNPIALKITTTGNLALEMGTGGAVESVLRAIEQDSTVVMYQVESSGTQLSVLVEASGAGTSTAATAGSSYTPATVATAIQTRLQGLTANIGIASNVYSASTTVASTGFKLA